MIFIRSFIRSFSSAFDCPSSLAVEQSQKYTSILTTPPLLLRTRSASDPRITAPSTRSCSCGSCIVLTSVLLPASPDNEGEEAEAEAEAEVEVEVITMCVTVSFHESFSEGLWYVTFMRPKNVKLAMPSALLPLPVPVPVSVALVLLLGTALNIQPGKAGRNCSVRAACKSAGVGVGVVEGVGALPWDWDWGWVFAVTLPEPFVDDALSPTPAVCAGGGG
jgi:hypothetical protein